MDVALVITNALVATGTLVVAIVAVFGETIRAWRVRPKLASTLNLRPPDSHKTAMRAKDKQGNEFYADAYYCRLRVENRGTLAAHNVEVYAGKLEKRRQDGGTDPVTTFLPMNLKWSHMGSIFFPRLGPGVPKHCDFFHIVKPSDRYRIESEAMFGEESERSETVISFDLMVKPLALGHLATAGRYEVELVIDGARYVGTGTWPTDVITGNEPSVALHFESTLPGLS